MSLPLFPLSSTGSHIYLDKLPANAEVTYRHEQDSKVNEFVEKLIQVSIIGLAVRVALIAMIRNNEVEKTTFGVIIVVLFLQIVMTVNRDFAIEQNAILLDALIGCIGGSIVGFEIRQALATPLGTVATIIIGIAIKAQSVETTLTALAIIAAIATLIKRQLFHALN